MDKIPKSRLETLMRITSVSGKTLSNVLHIDVSLISRWKNGKRKITNMDYLYDITNFFIELEDKHYLPTYYNLLNMTSDLSIEQVQESLALWLSLPLNDEDILRIHSLKTDSSSSDTYLKSYLGNSGRRQAVLDFLSTAAKLKASKIYLISREDIGWMVENPDFLKQWAAGMMKCITSGYEIYIIHTIKGSMAELSRVYLQWMPFYMTSKVHAFYINKQINTLPEETLFIAENTLVCQGNCYIGDDSQRYTALTNDLITIQSRQNNYLHLLASATRLNNIYQIKSLAKVFQSVISAGNNKEDSLFRSEELFFSTMPRHLLIEILDHNRVHEKIATNLINFYDQLNKNFNQNVKLFSNKHIYNLESLIRQAEEDNYRTNLLSIITGQDLWISRDQFIKHIESTIHRLLSNPHFQIGLYSPKTTDLPLEQLSFWVKETYFLTMWSRHSYKDIQVSTEPTMVETIKQFYSQLWDMIPVIDKDKDHVVAHLKKIIIIAKH